MRRRPGFHLGRLATRALNTQQPAPVESFDRALMFLAAFHAWGDTFEAVRTATAVSFVRGYLRDNLDVPESAVPAALFEELETLKNIPHALKKDAHPENWLIDEGGRLSMLDFESTKRQPVPFEVVQLLDDYPVLPATDEGWQKRLIATRRYLVLRTQFSGIQLSLLDEPLDFLYAVCLILRVKFGLRQVENNRGNLASSGALRARDARREHYRALASWLRGKHPHVAIRDFATILE